MKFTRDPKRTVDWIGKIEIDQLRRVVGRMMELLKEDDEQPVTLLITSGGGDTNIAFAFYDTVRFFNVNLVTIAQGEVSSAAIIVLLSGVRRYVTPLTTMCIHEGRRGFPDGVRFTEAQLAVELRDIGVYNEKYARVIANSTSLTMRQIRRMMQKDVVLSGDKIVEFGFAHEIV